MHKNAYFICKYINNYIILHHQTKNNKSKKFDLKQDGTINYNPKFCQSKRVSFNDGRRTFF